MYCTTAKRKDACGDRDGFDCPAKRRAPGSTRDEEHKAYEVIREGALLYKSAFSDMAAFEDQKVLVEKQLEESERRVDTLDRLLANQREDFAALISSNASVAALADKVTKFEQVTEMLTSLLNARVYLNKYLQYGDVTYIDGCMNDSRLITRSNRPWKVTSGSKEHCAHAGAGYPCARVSELCFILP